MEKKYVSLKEAELLLPDVQQSLTKLLDINNALGVLRQINIKYEDHFEDMCKEITMNKKFFELNAIFFKELERLLQMGCIVKDLNAGLVDFYSNHKGKEIMLCWKIGEDRINYWHDISNGYSGRKPISMLS